MFCEKCGNEIRKGETVCSKCGAAVSAPPQGGRSKKKFIIVAAMAVVLFVAAAAVCYLNSDPYLYASAVSCFNEGDYERAEKLFSRLEDYEDSGNLLVKCQYQHALECGDSGDYDRSLELIRACEASPYMQALSENDMVLCKERVAGAYRDSGRYEEAAGLYQELGKIWETAEVYAAMGNYAQAIELTENYECDGRQRETRGLWHRSQAVLCTAEGNYEDAWNYLKEYKGDYDEELRQCAYQTARSFLDNGKYEEVVAIAGMLKNDMEEAGLLLNECYEAWGIACAGEEDYAAAWECFRKCEVTEAGCPSLYATGQYYMNQGLYSDAHAIWDALGDYQDSAQQRAECCRRQGEELEQAGEYSSAIAMYEECGDAGLVTRCIYNWAASAYAQGDYELAIEKYTELGDYEDSVQMIKTCRYQQAQRAYSTGEYDLAIQIYTELGDYEDSAEKILQVQEAKQKAEIENEKKARRGALDGTWKTDNGNLHIEANGSNGSSLVFYLPIQYSSVTTRYGTSTDYSEICGINESNFEGADLKERQYYYGYSGTDMALHRVYYWDHWDYMDGKLYLRRPTGGWWIYDCTVSGNTMTLNMQERNFTLKKQ